MQLIEIHEGIDEMLEDFNKGTGMNLAIHRLIVPTQYRRLLGWMPLLSFVSTDIDLDTVREKKTHLLWEFKEEDVDFLRFTQPDGHRELLERFPEVRPSFPLEWTDYLGFGAIRGQNAANRNP